MQIDNGNVTIGNSRLININNTDLSTIIQFWNTDNIVVDNLVTYGCTSSNILEFTNYYDEPLGDPVQLQNSQFGSASAGGVHATNHSLTVTNTTFDSLVGEAIGLDNPDGSQLTVSGCNITNSGSAVSVQRTHLLITQSLVRNCSGGYSVMAIYSGGSGSLNDTTNQTATIDGCSFVNNTGGQGMIYMLGYDQYPVQGLNVYNSNFSGNTGESLGPVTLFAVGHVAIQNCVFEENVANTGLGALYVYGYPSQVTFLTVRSSSFVANNGTRSALPPTEGAGITDTAECGGLYASYCACVGVIDSVFENNTGIGFAVHGHGSTLGSCGSSDPVLFNQSTIVDSNGTAFFQNFMGRYDDIEIGLDIRGSSFTRNYAASVVRTTAEPETEPTDFLTGGAGLDILDVQFSFLSNNTFQDNVGRQGSGLNLDTCFLSIVWNCSFHNNTAAKQGGALALVNSHNLGVLVANSSLTYGQAVTGGAIYGDAGATITISNSSQIAHNVAVTDGGGVYCSSCQSLVLQMESEISSNAAYQSGGGCYCDSCVTFTADNTSLMNNRYAYSLHCCLTQTTDSAHAFDDVFMWHACENVFMVTKAVIMH